MIFKMIGLSGPFIIHFAIDDDSLLVKLSICVHCDCNYYKLADMTFHHTTAQRDQLIHIEFTVFPPYQLFPS